MLSRLILPGAAHDTGQRTLFIDDLTAKTSKSCRRLKPFDAVVTGDPNQ